MTLIKILCGAFFILSVYVENCLHDKIVYFFEAMKYCELYSHENYQCNPPFICLAKICIKIEVFCTVANIVDSSEN
jgi:hypothetical protein